MLDIAEEMERLNWGADGTNVKCWAARIRAYWTPERQAFVQAAEQWMETTLPLYDSPEEVFVSIEPVIGAYRAMREAEKK